MGILSIYSESSFNGNIENSTSPVVKSLGFSLKPYENSFYNSFYNRDDVEFFKKYLEGKIINAINDEPFRYQFTTGWSEGPGFKAAETVNGFIKSDVLKMLAGNEYMSLVTNDTWSQKLGSESSPLSIELKFKVYDSSSMYSSSNCSASEIIKFLFALTIPPFRYSLLQAYNKIEGVHNNLKNALSTDVKEKHLKKIFDLLDIDEFRERVQNYVEEKYTTTLENDDIDSNDDNFIKEEGQRLINEVKANWEGKIVFNNVTSLTTQGRDKNLAQQHVTVQKGHFDNFVLTYLKKIKTFIYNTGKSVKTLQGFSDVESGPLFFEKDSEFKVKTNDAQKLVGWNSYDIDHWNKIFTDSYIEDELENIFTKNDDSSVSLMTSAEKAFAKAENFAGIGDDWSNNPRGQFTVNLKTSDFKGNFWKSIDWYVKSFKFKPSVQVSNISSGIPLYTEFSVSLETVMSLSNVSIFKLFNGDD